MNRINKPRRFFPPRSADRMVKMGINGAGADFEMRAVIALKFEDYTPVWRESRGGGGVVFVNRG